MFHMMSTPKDMNECKTLGPPGTAFLGDGKVPGLLCYQQCARHQIWSTPAAKSPSSPKRQAPRRDQVCSEYCSWRSWNSLADSCKKMTDFMKHFTECPERVDTFGGFFAQSNLITQNRTSLSHILCHFFPEKIVKEFCKCCQNFQIFFEKPKGTKNLFSGVSFNTSIRPSSRGVCCSGWWWW